MKKAGFATLGCKVNQYETEAMAELFRNKGYKTVGFSERADVYVINTCSVTNMSDRKSRQMIHRAKKNNPDAVICVTGCYAQVSPEEVLDIDGVNLVIGTMGRSEIADIADRLDSGSKVDMTGDILKNHRFENLSVTGCTDRTRAYIKAQEGCSQFCSYCIIPFARGPVRSRPVADILSEARRLAANGFTEAVLTGIHIASFGKDSGEGDLENLLKKVSQTDGIRRIRLSSIEPMTLNEKFIAGIKECEKLCPHFHISLQSGSDSVLKRMNRHYTTEDFANIVAGLRDAYPDAAITTDVMVGFPGESDEEFAETVEFMKKTGFARAHIFEYSPRKGTKAAAMDDQIDPVIKKERSGILFEVAGESEKRFLDSHIGAVTEVLFERRCKNKPGFYEGKTANYMTVEAMSDDDISGKYFNVKTEKREGNVLIGSIL
ncbi:MAG: tRNA (N(6)-L-threonylcarbamoyladenosine(37)-C(2))-methylthiotransferase MtaB [Oscillospiraceae bacterium]|nr:tRNA (N(6)-L-threonylcarbamoyladenosine(37)-C(2))-methylthiotransferase MtaB [Oscillospiraceae bacterium]